MQHSAVFFGGVLLGGVLSAACGFDLYDGGAHEVVALRSRLEAASQELRSARDDRGRLLERELAAQRELRLLSSEVEHLGDEQDRSHAELTRVVAERRTLEERLTETRSGFEDVVRRARDETYRAEDLQIRLESLVVRYFSTPRPDLDRDLVLEFLERDGTLESTRQLIHLLAAHSPDILLSLNCPVRGRRSLLYMPECDPGFPGAALVPTSADERETVRVP